MKRQILLLTAAAALVGCGDRQPAGPSSAQAAPASAESAGLGLPPLDANGIPKFRPGLWDVVMNDSSSSDGPDHQRQCIGQEASEQIVEMLSKKSTPDCKVSKSTSARGLHVSSDCVQGGVKVKAELSLAGSETAYDLKLSMNMQTSDGKQSGGVITGKAKWLSACPQGMNPGDSEDVG